MGRKKVLVTGLTDNIGGTEAVVANYMRALCSSFQFDVLSFGLPVGSVFYEEGNRVISIPHKSKNPLRYYRIVNELFKFGGPYRTVWANYNNFLNIDALRLARNFAIPNRIAHVHNDFWIPEHNYYRFIDGRNRQLAVRYATQLVACSRGAGSYFFGSSCFRVINNAFFIDEYVFSNEKRKAFRSKYGLHGCHVIGTVGRLEEQKNQAFLIHLMPELLSKRSNVRLVIVGGGSLQKGLAELANQLGIARYVIFTGERPDAKQILNAFDVFAFPSLFEGLGLAAVEAQVNGLPCICSEGVPLDARISEPFIRLPVQATELWVDNLLISSRSSYRQNTKKMAKFDIGQEASIMASVLMGKTE